MRHIASPHPPTWTQSSPNDIWAPCKWIWMGKDTSNIMKSSWKSKQLQDKAPHRCLHQVNSVFIHAGGIPRPVASQGQWHPLPAGEEQDRRNWASGLLLELGFGSGSTGCNQRKSLLLTICLLVGAQIQWSSFCTNSAQCNVSVGSLLILVNLGQDEELACFLGAGQSSA